MIALDRLRLKQVFRLYLSLFFQCIFFLILNLKQVSALGFNQNIAAQQVYMPKLQNEIFNFS